MGGIVKSVSKGLGKGGILDKASDPLNIHKTFDPLHLYGNPNAEAEAATQAQLKSMSTETFNAAQPLLKASQTGTLTPAQQATIDQFKRSQTATLNQEMASAGLSKSAAAAELGGSVDEEAMALGQQYLQEDFNQAFQLLGLSAQELGANVNISMVQDQQNAEALGAMASVVGTVAGGMFGGPAGAAAGGAAGSALGKAAAG